MNSRFVIVNDCDAPIRTNVAELVEGKGYCYMARSINKMLKQFDGMMPRQPTPIEEFGFTAEIIGSMAHFRKTHECRATYPDGKPRRWQDASNSHEFMLPLVVIKPKKGTP